jgi:hypothetical protein
MYPHPHSSQSLAKFAFTHSEVRAKPQFKFHKHSAAMVNSMNNTNSTNNTNTNKSMTVGGSKPRAAVFDGIRIIQDLRTVTGMCGACK